MPPATEYSGIRSCLAGLFMEQSYKFALRQCLFSSPVPHSPKQYDTTLNHSSASFEPARQKAPAQYFDTSSTATRIIFSTKSKQHIILKNKTIKQPSEADTPGHSLNKTFYEYPHCHISPFFAHAFRHGRICIFHFPMKHENRFGLPFISWTIADFQYPKNNTFRLCLNTKITNSRSKRHKNSCKSAK